MNARESVALLRLLAQYASEYGVECDPRMTVVELADDLAQSVLGEYAPASVPEELRDEVELGFTGKVK
jgi:hypothetical protein